MHSASSSAVGYRFLTRRLWANHPTTSRNLNCSRSGNQSAGGRTYGMFFVSAILVY